MKRQRMMVLGIAVWAVALAAGAAGATGQAVSDLMEQIPWENGGDGNRICAALVALGPEAIQEVCGQLTPPGVDDDTTARYAVSGLAKYASGPAGVSARRLVSDSFAAALAAEADPEVKAFLIQKLQQVGEEEAVEPLAGYLSDARLCDPAARALVSIGTRNAQAALVKALAGADEARCASLISAVGQLEMKQAAALVAPYATNENREIRLAALAALADIGNPDSAAVMAAAAASEPAYEHAKATAYHLAYAKRLAERGHRREGRGICEDLLGGAAEAQVRSAALSTLVETDGKKALGALLAAMADEDPAVRASALKMAARIPGKRPTKAWGEEMVGAAPAVQAEIAAMLGRRADPAALPALWKVAEQAEPAAQAAALEAIGRLSAPDDVAKLVRTAVEAESEEVRSAAAAAACRAAYALGEPVAAGNAVATAVAAVIEEKGLVGEEREKVLVAFFPVLRHADPVPEGLPNVPPQGFVALFNGIDLEGWKGLAGEGGSPLSRARMSPEELKEAQKKADESMRAHWRVEDGALVFDGKGESLCTARDYGDFEMLVDWKILENGDSGIYLRGSPQVQIWDPNQQKIGSGGIYNNQKNPSQPLVMADNPIGEWNTFRIKMVGDRVTVHLNGQLVVDNVVMENYWDRALPIFPSGQIELQNHGNTLYFRNVFIREIPREEPPAYLEEGFVSLFNGNDLTGWTGATDGYGVENGTIVCREEGGGNLYTEQEFADFVLRFEFKLTPGANNGLGIRAPLTGNSAYDGMELQILDNTAEQYANLQPYQYHGSVYGISPARRGCLKPVGEWNAEQVIAHGNRITVWLNGAIIVDTDLAKATASGTADGREHPGLMNPTGHIGFLGHGSHVEFRNIRIKEIR